MAGTVTSIRTGTTIEGGGLRQPCAAPEASVESVQGLTFFNVSRSDRSFARFLGLNCSTRAPWQGSSTLDYLCNLRNAVLEEWVCDKWAESNDPCADVQPSPNKKARKDIMDDAPEVLELTIPAQGKSLAVYTMKVLAKAKKQNDQFAFELTEENFEHVRLMAMHPPALEQEGRWLYRNDTKYSDAFPDVRAYHRAEWRTWQLRVRNDQGVVKSLRIPATEDDVTWKTLADEAAATLQAWRFDSSGDAGDDLGPQRS